MLKNNRALLRCKILLFEAQELRVIANIFVTHLEHKHETVRFQQIEEIIEYISSWIESDADSKFGHLLLGKCTQENC